MGLSLLTVPLTNREYPPPPPPSLSSSSSSSFFLLLLPGCFVFRCTPKTQLTDITLAPRHSFDNVYRSKPYSYAAFRPPRIDRGGTIETPDPISYRFHAAPRRNRGECERLSGTDRYGERLRNLDIFPDR